jgi:hypothetical protein
VGLPGYLVEEIAHIAPRIKMLSDLVSSCSHQQHAYRIAGGKHEKITGRFDEPVHTFLAHLAAEQQVSFSQLINETLARCVMAEQSFEMMDARAARARPGTMQQVLARAAAHGLAPLQPEDALPPGVDRRLPERQVSKAWNLREGSQGSKQTDRRDEAQSQTR